MPNQRPERPPMRFKQPGNRIDNRRPGRVLGDEQPKRVGLDERMQ